MKSLEERIDEFIASTDDGYSPIPVINERRILMQEALDKGGWDGLSKLCGRNMKPMRIRIEELHAAGRI